MSLYNDIERILKNNSATYLAVLESRFGVDIKVYRPVKDKYTDVYQNNSGIENLNPIVQVKGLYVGDQFSSIDAYASNTPDGGTLYLSEGKVQVGDLVAIGREDLRSRRFKVVSREALGSTKAVMYKYNISSLGD